MADADEVDAPVTTCQSRRLCGRWLSILLLVGAAAVLCFSRLDVPLLQPEETRYAEIPRQMLADGRWVVPVLDGQPYYDKPPLLYWLVMASYATFGTHDWAAVLVARLATFLCVLLVYFGGRRAVGHRGALAGGFVLCLSARYLYLGRLLTLDGLLCLWIVAALGTAHRALCRPHLGRGWWFLSAAAAGLGVMTKGPVALVLVAVPVLTLPRLDARAVRPGVRAWLSYLAGVAVVAGPWYAAVVAADPAFAEYFFWKHNVVRFVAPFDHAKPFWYFVPELLLDMLPWTLLLPSLAGRLAQGVRKGDRRSAALLYWSVASLWCLLFFSASGSKRAVYLLPALPPLALALGCHLERQARRWTQAPRPAFPWLAWASLVLVLTAGASIPIAAVVYGFLSPGAAAPWVALSLAAAPVLAYFGPGLREPAVWKLCAVVIFALLDAGIHGILPAYAASHAAPHERRGPSCHPRKGDVHAHAPRDGALEAHAGRDCRGPRPDCAGHHR